jgi:hypothetical protein
LGGPGRIQLRGVHRPFSALQSPQPRRIAWPAFPKARQAPSQRDQATIAVRSMVAWQLRNPGRSMPAARGCAPASACRAGLALTLPPSRHTIAVYCKHSVCFHVSFYVPGKRPQSLRSLHVCSTATHHEGGTHARAHTVTQRERESKLVVCLCVAMSSCQWRCHTPQAQAAEACPVVVGMWGKGTCWCLARGLFYPAGAPATMMTGGEAKGIRIIGWGVAGRRRLQHQQRPAGDHTMKTNSQRWCMRQLLPFGPASQPAISSHDLPSACAAAALGTTHADADAGSHAGAASSFRFRSHMT